MASIPSDYGDTPRRIFDTNDNEGRCAGSSDTVILNDLTATNTIGVVADNIGMQSNVLPSTAVFNNADTILVKPISVPLDASSSGVDLVVGLNFSATTPSANPVGVQSDDNSDNNSIPQPVPMTASTPAATSTIITPIPTFSIELAVIELSRLETNEPKDCYFTVSSKSETPLDLMVAQEVQEETVHDNFELRNLSKTVSLAPGEVKRVYMTLIPKRIGRDSAQFSVTSYSCSNDSEVSSIHGADGINSSIGTTMSVKFKWFTIARTYLRFPSLTQSTELSLGFCYVDPGKRFAKITPFIVENIYQEDVFITAISNLALQCLVFADASLETPLADILLSAGASMTVYIALQPYLNQVSSSAAPRRAEKPLVIVGSGSGGGTSTGSSSASATSTAVNTGVLSAPTTSSSSLSSTDCRTLIGGIKFLVSLVHRSGGYGVDGGVAVDLPAAPLNEPISTNPNLFLHTIQVVKFSSLIGNSIMGVSKLVVDLGITYSLNQVCYGGFFLLNLSAKMPLEFYIERPECVIVSPEEGSIAGSDGREDTSVPFSRQWITCHVTPSQYGYYSKYLYLKNRNNSSQIISIEARLFVDPRFISCSGSGLRDGEPTAEMISPARVEYESPPLVWENIYVSINPELSSSDPRSGAIVLAQKRGAPVQSQERSIEIENISDDSIELLPKCLLDVSVRWTVASVAGTVLNMDLDLSPLSSSSSAAKSNELMDSTAAVIDTLGMPVRGTNKLILHPSNKALMYISCPKPDSLSDEDKLAVSNGKRVCARGILHLCNSETSETIKIVNLLSYYCVSRAEIDLPTGTLDLGKIGHANSWNDVRFSFIIKNVSDIPLLYDVDLPDTIELVSDEATDYVAASKRRVEAKQAQTVVGIFKPRNIKQIGTTGGGGGPCNFELVVKNVYNPKNVMVVSLNAFLTLNELKFERLVEGELILPQLLYPQVSTNIACDTWFTIVNSAEEDIKFEIGMSLAPDVAEFIRIEILSRFSNSPLVGSITLAPAGVIEVRVRAYPKENVRIPVDNPSAKYLTNPDGLTFGAISVTPKKPGDDASKRMVENIPVRGKITEVPTFILSEKRLEFKSFDNSDDEDDAKSTSTAGGADAEGTSHQHVQRRVVYITNLSQTFSLDYILQMEYPMECSGGLDGLKISPINSDMSGCVPPGGKTTLFIELEGTKIGGLSENIRMTIIDTKSINRYSQAVLIGIVEEMSAPPRLLTQAELLGATGAGGDNIVSLDNNADQQVRPTSLPIQLIDELKSAALLFSGVDGDAFSAVSLGGPAASNVAMLPLPPSALAATIIASTASVTGTTTSSNYISTSEATKSAASDVIIMPSSTTILSESPFMEPLTFSEAEISANYSSPIRRSNPLLTLRGCKKLSDFGCLFELDLGQQDLSSVIITKKIVLESGSAIDRVSYRIKCLSVGDQNWIMPSRLDGTLEPSRSQQKDSHQISLNFMPNIRGVYKTYLIIENVDTPMDTKTIRVCMEVVAKQNIRRTAAGVLMNTSSSVSSATSSSVSSPYSQFPELLTNHVFDVYVNGVDAETANFEMDYLFYGTDYSARSLVICNRENSPLEVVLKSNLGHDDMSELCFSLSRTSAKVVGNGIRKIGRSGGVRDFRLGEGGVFF